MTAAAWPRTLLIPPAAVPLWLALHEALLVQVTPCAADAELWHSHNQSDIEAASDACHTCHALAPCGQYANAAGEVGGVWAGVDRGRRPTPSRNQKETRCQD